MAMALTREQLRHSLSILGNKNVYFQAPESFKMVIIVSVTNEIHGLIKPTTRTIFESLIYSNVYHKFFIGYTLKASRYHYRYTYDVVAAVIPMYLAFIKGKTMVALLDQEGERHYETGVIAESFPHGTTGYEVGVPWNSQPILVRTRRRRTPLYADNIKYLNLISAEELLHGRAHLSRRVCQVTGQQSLFLVCQPNRLVKFGLSCTLVKRYSWHPVW